MKTIDAPSRSTSLKETPERGARSAERGEHNTAHSAIGTERSAWRTRVGRLIWFLGIAVLVGSVAGTGLVLYTRAGDGAPRAGDSVPATTEPSAASVVCFGHVDVEPGVTA